MKTERTEFAGQPAWLWTTEVAPRAVILALHGMTEHAGRFDTFARYMTAQGIAVAAYDLRGHGHLAPTDSCAAMAPGDWARSIDDIGAALAQLRAMFPGRKLFLLGFSLGSFLVREYMSQPNIDMDGIILVGTGYQPRWLLRLMKRIVKAQINKLGYETAAPLVRQLSFGTYNQKFKPVRTDYDWLCSDEAQIDAYMADPLCRKGIASGTFYELLDSMERTASPPCGGPLPVLLMGGDRDAVGNFGKGIHRVWQKLEYSRWPVDMTVYPGARHMLLREEANGQAQAARTQITEWINKHI